MTRLLSEVTRPVSKDEQLRVSIWLEPIGQVPPPDGGGKGGGDGTTVYMSDRSNWRSAGNSARALLTLAARLIPPPSKKAK